MKLESPNLEEYLSDLPELTIHSAEIKQLRDKLFCSTYNDIEKIDRAFHFVRDEIDHSWDSQNSTVTCTALEVLRAGHGICYAKANLLAALLRSTGVPTGFCYQKLLLFDKEDDRYCIHALNAVFIASCNRWMRVDARGNKLGIEASFDIDREKLAFLPDNDLGELDYPMIYTKPNSLTMSTLLNAANSLEMYIKNLPEAL